MVFSNWCSFLYTYFFSTEKLLKPITDILIFPVPGYIVGETELEASKEGRSFTDFKYACVGYSVYLDKKDSSNEPQNKQAELPFCVGLEVKCLGTEYVLF